MNPSALFSASRPAVVDWPDEAKWYFAERFDDLAGGETMTTVTFSEPGQSRLIAIGNDDSSGPGEGSTRQGCWTTAHVDVTVSP